MLGNNEDRILRTGTRTWIVVAETRMGLGTEIRAWKGLRTRVRTRIGAKRREGTLTIITSGIVLGTRTWVGRIWRNFQLY